MTICIAATCDNSVIGEGKIVLCTDGLESSPLGSRNNVRKHKDIVAGWHMLTAGNPDNLRAFERFLKASFKKAKAINETTIVEIVRSALVAVKTEQCEEYIYGKYAVDYATYLREGKKMFLDGELAKDAHKIASISPNIDCIVAGFADAVPTVLWAYFNGGEPKAGIAEGGFALAGHGADLARVSLAHRQHHEHQPLDRTLYCVYEAKKYAERDNTVNDITHMSVLSRDKLQFIRADGRNYLEKQYGKYGPKKISQPIVMEPGFFRDRQPDEPLLGPQTPDGWDPTLPSGVPAAGPKESS